MTPSGSWAGPVIETGVPLPSRKKINRTIYEAMEKMKVGESIHIVGMSHHAIHAIARRLWGAGKYTTRGDLRGHRIWRGRCVGGNWE